MNKESQSETYFGKVKEIISAYKKLDFIGLNRGASNTRKNAEISVVAKNRFSKRTF